MSLTGCSSAGTGTVPTDTAITETADNAAAETADTAAADQGSAGVKGTGEQLVIYSNSVSDGRGDWLKERALQDGFKIEYVDAGGGDIQNRLVAEKNSPVADVVFGLNNMYFENLKSQDLLEKYIPSWAGETETGISDKDDYFHATVKQYIFLIYNSDKYTPETAPEDWPDLWEKEELHGIYQLPDGLGGASIQTILAGILVRYQDPNGELGVSEDGWKAMEQFFKYSTKLATGEDLYAKLASGESPITLMWSSGIAAREEQYGIKAGIVNPEIGIPTIFEQVGIVKGSKKLDEAKRFVDWFGSVEIQGEWSKQFSTIPVNKGAMDQVSEENKQMNDTYKTQDIDWSFVAKYMNDWVEKIELDYAK
ncbi:MAG: extracellular solute-binding protein [Anaerocolumna sp.]